MVLIQPFWYLFFWFISLPQLLPDLDSANLYMSRLMSIYMMHKILANTNKSQILLIKDTN